MKDYIKLAMRTCSPRFHKDLVSTNVLHGAIGMSTEANELLDAIKKALFYGKPIDETNIKEECGDILWYMAAICDHYGFTIEDAMVANIAKLMKRYPDQFTAEGALVRDLDEERKALDQDLDIPEFLRKETQEEEQARRADFLRQKAEIEKTSKTRGGKDGEEPVY